MKLPRCKTNKPIYCTCHWCKTKKLQYRKSMWNHEDSCIDNPEFVKIIRELNHLQNNQLEEKCLE